MDLQNFLAIHLSRAIESFLYLCYQLRVSEISNRYIY